MLGLLVHLTCGLLLIPLSLIWIMFFYVPLLTTSWLWIHVPILRPLLLVPGVVFSEVAGVFAAMMPEMGDWGSRATKQALCESWPHSLHLVDRR